DKYLLTATEPVLRHGHRTRISGRANTTPGVDSIGLIQLGSRRFQMLGISRLHREQAEFDGGGRIELSAVVGESRPNSTTGLHIAGDCRFEGRGREAYVVDHEDPGRVAIGNGRPVEYAEI